MEGKGSHARQLSNESVARSETADGKSKESRVDRIFTGGEGIGYSTRVQQCSEDVYKSLSPGFRIREQVINIFHAPISDYRQSLSNQTKDSLS